MAQKLLQLYPLFIALILGIIFYNSPQKAFANAWLHSGKSDTCNLVDFSVSESPICNYTSTNNVSSYAVNINVTNHGNPKASHTITYITNTSVCMQGYLSNNNPPGDCIDNTQRISQTVSVPTTIVMNRTYNNNICGSYQEDFYVTAIDGDTNCTYGTWGLTNGTYDPGINSLCQTGSTCSGPVIVGPPTATPTPVILPTLAPTLPPPQIACPSGRYYVRHNPTN